jgi:hypothetical protein
MASSGIPFYADFPAIKTFEVREIGHIYKTVEEIASHYERTGLQAQFCVRILLPRGGTLDSLAKRLGLIIQGELLSSLRKKNLRPNVREIRYVHNENNYGWLLLSPKLYEEHLVKTKR